MGHLPSNVFIRYQHMPSRLLRWYRNPDCYYYQRIIIYTFQIIIENHYHLRVLFFIIIDHLLVQQERPTAEQACFTMNQYARQLQLILAKVVQLILSKLRSVSAKFVESCSRIRQQDAVFYNSTSFNKWNLINSYLIMDTLHQYQGGS